MSAGATVDAARRLATEAHLGQRYGETSYVDHLQDVVNILAGLPCGPQLRAEVFAAAWLHDVLEDTVTPVARVEAECGPIVRDLVDAVTRSPGSPRRLWLDRLYKTLKQADPDAALIKVADRLANVRACWATRDRRLFMYYREHPKFRAALHGDLRAETLWVDLDALLDFGGRRRW